MLTWSIFLLRPFINSDSSMASLFFLWNVSIFENNIRVSHYSCVGHTHRYTHTHTQVPLFCMNILLISFPRSRLNCSKASSLGGGVEGRVPPLASDGGTSIRPSSLVSVSGGLGMLQGTSHVSLTGDDSRIMMAHFSLLSFFFESVSLFPPAVAALAFLTAASGEAGGLKDEGAYVSE